MRTLFTLAACVLLGLSTTAYAKENGQKRFAKLDTDGNESISLAEFKAASDKRQGKLLKADQDGDGLVSQQEFDQQMAERATKMKARMQEHFASMDLDNNGLVSPDEAKEVMFNRIDTDDNGVVSKRELRQAKRARHP